MKAPAELVGARVSRVAFDHQVRISFCGHARDGRIRVDAELVIETPFTLADAAGHQTTLTPGAGTALGPLLGLFDEAVTACAVTELGTLLLGFEDGTRLSVAPDPPYESWGITGSGIDPVLVGPCGEADWQH